MSADDFDIEWALSQENWLEHHDNIRKKIKAGKVFGIAFFKERIPDIEIYIDSTLNFVYRKVKFLWLLGDKNENRLIERIIWRLSFEVLHELSHRLSPATCGDPTLDNAIDEVLDRMMSDPGVDFYA